MNYQIDVSFDYDFDSDLYMFSKAPDAKNWKVIVHVKNGDKKVPSIAKYSAYPGSPTHEGETAWSVDYFNAEKIEIQRANLESVFVRHPHGNLTIP